MKINYERNIIHNKFRIAHISWRSEGLYQIYPGKGDKNLIIKNIETLLKMYEFCVIFKTTNKQEPYQNLKCRMKIYRWLLEFWPGKHSYISFYVCTKFSGFGKNNFFYQANNKQPSKRFAIVKVKIKLCSFNMKCL